MKQGGRRSGGSGGFTVLELVVVLCVLVGLAAFLVPAVQGAVDESNVAEVADLYESLKGACERHVQDTARFPHEYSGVRYDAAAHHELSETQDYDGWRGPYLDRRLSAADHPWDGNIHLYNYLLVNGLIGWDLDADGEPEASTQESASVLWLTGVREEWAQSLDARLDTTAAPSTVDWRQAGVVQWAPAAGGTVWMLVLRDEPRPDDETAEP